VTYLSRLIESVRNLPAEAQEDIARLLLQLTGRDERPLPMSAEEEASFDESFAQA
jgi:hypothetical protein